MAKNKIDFDTLTSDDKIRIQAELDIAREERHRGSISISLPSFSGKLGDSDYETWQYAWKLIETDSNISDKSKKALIVKSLKGEAAQLLHSLNVTATLTEIISSIELAFGDVTTASTAWQQFYDAKQQPTESVVSWRIRLQSLLHKASDDFMTSDNQCIMKTQLWTKLYNCQTRNASRHKFDDASVTVDQLVKYIRTLEHEQPDVKLVVHAVSTDTTDVQKRLSNLEQMMEKLLQRDINDATRRTPPRQDTAHDNRCHCCGRRGHQARTCWFNNNQNYKRQGNFMGHQ